MKRSFESYMSIILKTLFSNEAGFFLIFKIIHTKITIMRKSTKNMSALQQHQIQEHTPFEINGGAHIDYSAQWHQ